LERFQAEIQHHFSTVLRGEHGANEEVEISAASVPTGEDPCYGFTIRNAGREPAKPRRPRELPRSVERLTQLADNRASAARASIPSSAASASAISTPIQATIGRFFAVAVISHVCALPWRWCC